MINYIQKKKIRESRISELLKKSVELNQFTNDGPVKKDLEKLLHIKLNLPTNKAVVCLSNGTAACHTLMYLFERKNNKKLKWITPAFTFPAPVVGGFSAKITDIDNQTYTISSSDPKVKKADGVIITNLFGTCNAIEEWEDYCKKENKILIFDNASSPMTSLNGKNICAYGNASFGSLHHTKYFGFGEGGFAVVDVEDYEALNSIANFGFTSQRVHHGLSSNFKMSEIAAAYCYTQVESYDVRKHIEIQNALIKNLLDIDLQVFNINNDGVEYVLGNVPVLFNKPVDFSSYRNLGIEANKYYRPLAPLKNSKDIFSRIINLPLNDGLTDYEIEMICKVSYEIKRGLDEKK
jgi:dTDP-4-amino-4,6-dideoxygalactose transaminase